MEDAEQPQSLRQLWWHPIVLNETSPRKTSMAMRMVSESLSAGSFGQSVFQLLDANRGVGNPTMALFVGRYAEYRFNHHRRHDQWN